MHNKKPTIYLVTVDMDGTLLHNDKSISDYTINVLRKIVEKGILLVPASGRPLNGMKAAVLNNVKGIKYAICSNGAMLMDVQKEKSISETGIPIEKALEALKYPYIRFSEGTVKNLGEFLRTSGVNVMKMGAYILTDELAQKLLEKGSPIPGIAFLRSGDGIIELNSTNASKGNALCILCEKLGIQLENVLAIGDNENDISMLQAAGISAAMRNAEDDVKQAAKFVAGNNEEDGAAHFLEEWVL